MAVKNESYSYKEGEITIIDDELHIKTTCSAEILRLPKDFVEPMEFKEKSLEIKTMKNAPGAIYQAHIEKKGQFHGQWSQYYPDGNLKSEIFYSQGELHGPSSFFSPSGELISKTWFIEGLRHGKSIQRYLSGELYSMQRFNKGKREGKQEYFYEDGSLKTLMNFKDDLQEGKTKLYYPNRQLKREIEFVDGKKMGVDRFWNLSGLLTEESFYQGHLRHKSYRRWHPNGKIAIEYIYHIPPTLYDESIWSIDGVLLKKGCYNKNDQSYLRIFYDKNGVEKSQMLYNWDGEKLTPKLNASY